MNNQLNQYVSGNTVENTNNDEMLLNMYGKLINPLKTFENTCDEKDRVTQNILNAQNTISSAFLTPIVASIMFSFTLSIPFCVLFWIITNLTHNPEGIKYASIFFQWEEECKFVSTLSSFMEEWFPLFPIIILAIIEFMIIPTVVVLLPVLFILAAIYTVFSVISAKHTLSGSMPYLSELEKKIDCMVEQLSSCLSIVPPDYRYSEAVEFFYNSYCNRKVSTIKEAVLLYDQYCHLQRMEENQKELIQTHNELLQNIQLQNMELSAMNSKLRSIEWNTFWN